MKTLSTADLSLVTGGKTIADVAPNNSNDQITSTLQNIQSSLKDLSKNQGGLFGGQNGLMFMTMALALSNRRSEVVVTGGCRRGCWRRW